MCIAISFGWLRYTTIYIITTVYTIAYTWVHTLAYVWYCKLYVTLNSVNVLLVLHEASGTTLEWMCLGNGLTRAGTINKSDIRYDIGSYDPESEWGFFKRVVPLKYEVAQTLSARRTLYYRELLLLCDTIDYYIEKLKGLKNFVQDLRWVSFFIS
jgi:hypothetical protein